MHKFTRNKAIIGIVLIIILLAGVLLFMFPWLPYSPDSSEYYRKKYPSTKDASACLEEWAQHDKSTEPRIAAGVPCPGVPQ